MKNEALNMDKLIQGEIFYQHSDARNGCKPSAWKQLSEVEFGYPK